MTRKSVGLAGWAALLVSVALSAGCSSKSGSEEDPPPSSSSRPGMGSSKERPVGTTYTLPAGVGLEKPIKGHDAYCIPTEQEKKEEKGSGGLVRVCLNFRNTTGLPITVVFPPGLVFISESEEATQNGVLLQEVSIEVPARAESFFVPLYGYCLNKGRDPTTSSLDLYSLGPVTQDASVLELTSLVKAKKLALVDPDFTLQKALWNITESTGLTSDDRQAISKL